MTAGPFCISFSGADLINVFIIIVFAFFHRNVQISTPPHNTVVPNIG